MILWSNCVQKRKPVEVFTWQWRSQAAAFSRPPLASYIRPSRSSGSPLKSCWFYISGTLLAFPRPAWSTEAYQGICGWRKYNNVLTCGHSNWDSCRALIRLLCQPLQKLTPRYNTLGAFSHCKPQNWICFLFCKTQRIPDFHSESWKHCRSPCLSLSC